MYCISLLGSFYLYWDAAVGMFRAGLVNTADQTPEWLGFFWYEVCGLFVIFTGCLIHHYIRVLNKQIPKVFGYFLFLIGLLGCILEPVSGFYIFVVISGLILFQKNEIQVTQSVS